MLTDVGPVGTGSGVWGKGRVLVEMVTTGDITRRRGATKRRKGRGWGLGEHKTERQGIRAGTKDPHPP